MIMCDVSQLGAVVKISRFALGLFLVFVLSACSDATGLSVVDAWARPTEAGKNSAVYFQLFNGGSADEALLSADSDVARAVEIHETMAVDMEGADELDSMVDSENGGMAMEALKMVLQERVDIFSGETVVFTPGGLHVMLIDLNEQLAVGDEFSMTLNFESGSSMLLTVEVKQP